MITLFAKLFTANKELAKTGQDRPMEKFEELMLKNMQGDPSKWFLDYSSGLSLTLRAVNREKGVAIAVDGIESDRDGFLKSDKADGQAYCGRADLTNRFSITFREWAVAEFNARLREDLDREHKRVSEVISEAFK